MSGIDANSKEGAFPNRRYVTDKYGYISFALVGILILLVILLHSVLGPVAIAFVNEKPTRVRKFVNEYNWTRIGLWVLTFGLVACTFLETESFDLYYLAKRLGRQIVALMPAMYLLTLRPSPLPRTLYLDLVPIHKFLSRVVVIYSVLHGVLYTLIYYKVNTLMKVWKLANVLGILALIIFISMGVSGMARIRGKIYEYFYQIHVIGAWLCLPMLQYHSRPRSNLYLGMCAVFLGFQVIAKFWKSSITKLRVQYVSPTLLLVTIPKSELSGKQWWNWSVSSHLRLSGSIVNPLNWVRSSHPYTIASLPEDGEIKLVIRPGDYKVKMRKNYTIFGTHRCVPDYLLYQIHSYMVRRAILVIGGAGIAFGAPMMRYLRLHGADVRLVWVMRDPFDARVLPQLSLHEEVLRGNVEIYYTGLSLLKGDDLEDQTLSIHASENCCDEDTTGMTSIRSATRHPGVASRRVRNDPLLSQYAIYMSNARPHLNLRLKSWLYGYSPDNMDCCCADRVIESCAEDRLGAWVMACGSSQLNHAAEKWATDAGVGYFQDSFTL